MTFLSPQRLWLILAVVALAAGYIFLQWRRRAYTVRFTNVNLLVVVAPKRPGWRRHIAALIYVLALSTLVSGSRNPHATSAYRATGHDHARRRHVAVDGGHRRRPDPDRSGTVRSQAVPPDHPSKINVGLVAFNGPRHLRCHPPPSRPCRASIDNLSLGESTAIGEAIFVFTRRNLVGAARRSRHTTSGPHRVDVRRNTPSAVPTTRPRRPPWRPTSRSRPSPSAPRTARSACPSSRIPSPSSSDRRCPASACLSTGTGIGYGCSGTRIVPWSVPKAMVDTGTLASWPPASASSLVRPTVVVPSDISTMRAGGCVPVVGRHRLDGVERAKMASPMAVLSPSVKVVDARRTASRSVVGGTSSAAVAVERHQADVDLRRDDLEESLGRGLGRLDPGGGDVGGLHRQRGVDGEHDRGPLARDALVAGRLGEPEHQRASSANR